MDVRVLGPIEVRVDGEDVTPTSPNQCTVFAVLAAHPDQHVSIDTLVDAIWGCEPPPSADRTLRSYVSRLRGRSRRLHRRQPRRILLAPNEIQLDSHRFRAAGGLGQAARASAPPRSSYGRPSSAVARLRLRRVSRSRTPFARGPGTGATQGRRTGAVCECLTAVGAEFAAAVAEAEALLVELPLDECAWEMLIRSPCGGGRTADALGGLSRADDALAAIGLEPTERLRLAQPDAFEAPAPVPYTPDGHDFPR